jgi:hypothetical protein
MEYGSLSPSKSEKNYQMKEEEFFGVIDEK